MSFTPPSTAEMAMNSRPNASAISRASVVLPVPGGPQRIIECGRPDSKATRSGLPGPSRCAWPITSSRRRGRSRSASGAAGLSSANRSVVIVFATGQGAVVVAAALGSSRTRRRSAGRR
jgi:hypothetical protein